MSALDEDSYTGPVPSHVRYKESLRRKVTKYLPEVIVIDCPASGSWRKITVCFTCEYYQGRSYPACSSNTIHCNYTIGN